MIVFFLSLHNLTFILLIFLRQSLIIDHQKYAKIRLAIKVRKKNWCRAEEGKCGGDDDDGGDGCNCGRYHNRNVIVDYFDERVSGNR